MVLREYTKPERRPPQRANCQTNGRNQQDQHRGSLVSLGRHRWSFCRSTCRGAAIFMTPEQRRHIKLALENHRRRQRTPGARIRDAILHTKNSVKKSPGCYRGSSSLMGSIMNCSAILPHPTPDRHIVAFPRSLPGWLQRRRKCSGLYRLPYHAATQRDERQDICTGCFIEAMQR